MKKRISIFIAVITAFSLMAFGYMNLKHTEPSKEESWSKEEIPDTSIKKNSDEIYYSNFIYDIDSRFRAMKKSDLNHARNMSDFLDEDQIKQIVSYQSVSVIVIKNDNHTDIIETGSNQELIASQLDLLQSSDYSTNLKIMANIQEINYATGKLEYQQISRYITVVPETQAYYINGEDALLTYLRANNKENTANLNEKKLQPAKLYFTITKDGNISNVKLDRTSGYTSIDQTMMDLITNISGKWMPAKNSNDEAVDQELVISFGMLGC